MYKTDEERALSKIYGNMVGRCTNPKTNGFKYYGGKGITICPEWSDRKQFIKWGINSGYKIGLSIDRKDSNGNYEPSNCQWITKAENSSKANSKADLYGPSEVVYIETMVGSSVKFNIPRILCHQCGHQWWPRKSDVMICPRCKSAYWNKPKRTKNNKQKGD